MPDSRQDTTTDLERTELEQLSTRLAARGSVMHFAVALVASFVCMIAAGITVKLGFDRNYFLSSVTGVVALACLGVSLRGFWQGRKFRSQEHTEYRRLLELRTKAGLD